MLISGISHLRAAIVMEPGLCQVACDIWWSWSMLMSGISHLRTCLCHGTRLVMSVACDIWWSWLMLVAGTGLFLHCRCPGTMLSCSGLLYDVVQLLRIAALVFMLIATST